MSDENESETDRQGAVESTDTSYHAVTPWRLDSAMPRSMTGALDWQPGAAQCDLVI